MSTRDLMIAITSIEPLRSVVGSKDQSLFDLLLRSTEAQLEAEYGPRDELEDDDLEEFEEQLNETKSDLKRMLLNAKPPSAEPGGWIFLIKQIVQAKELAVRVDFAFNKGYKHWYAWQPYREAVAARLSEPALEALLHLENGRPLRGKRIDYDGCLFAWLTQAEIAVLHQSLAKLAASDIGNPDLEEFHEDVVNALTLLKQKECDLILGAH